MPFLTINFANGYDPENQKRYATQAEADARAREILQQFPTAQVSVVEVLKEYTAKVTVTAKDPQTVVEEPTSPE